MVPRSIPANYYPGDVLPDGSIVIGRRSRITQGIVFVTAKQARKAVERGWYLVDEEENDEGLVRVSKRAGRHHSYPFGKSVAGKNRRQERRHRRRERLELIDAKIIIDEDD